MSRIQSASAELLELIALTAAGEAEAGHVSRLDRALDGNPLAQRLYLDFCQLDADLRLREQAGSAHRGGMALIDAAISSAAGADEEQAWSEPLAHGWRGHWERVVDWANQPLTLALTIATLTISIVLLSMALWIVPALPRSPEVAARPEFVARLAASAEARWSPSAATELAEGRDLFIGQKLELLSGTALLRFDNGAEARLHGPAVFQIDSSNALFLDSGRLSARVPSRAVGFGVSTQLADIVDLGTEFSVEAGGRHASTDIHVFDGSVRVSTQPRAGVATAAVKLAAGHALRVENYERPTIGELAFNETAVARLRFTTATADEREQIPAQEHLAVWLSADEGVEADELRRLQRWRTRQPAEESQPQACLPMGDAPPKFVPSLFRGRASIEFGAASSLLKLSDIELEEEVTIAAVLWPRSGGGTRQMILRLEGEGVFGLDWNEHHQLQGRYFAQAGDSPSRTDTAVASVDNVPAAPLLAVYSYSQPRDRAELFINGKSVAVAPAPAAAGGLHTLTLGGHPQSGLKFVGRVAEVLVFRRALDVDEVKRLNRFMDRQYKLTK